MNKNNSLSNKIDFTLLVTAKKCNPNGTFEENRPRTDTNGHGEMSVECIKRKIRNRLQDLGCPILLQAADRATDNEKSIHTRAMANTDFAKAQKAGDRDACFEIACREWFDVRAFGQVFALQKEPVSFGVNGPVSIEVAETVDPVEVTTMTITKALNGEPTKNGERSSDTVGSKSRIEFGLFVIRGSINCFRAAQTGFTEADADMVLKALATLFENDGSAARPEGSMEVRKMYIWRHNCASGQYSKTKIKQALHVVKKTGVNVPASFEDYDICIDELPGLEVEEIEP